MIAFILITLFSLIYLAMAVAPIVHEQERLSLRNE